LGRSVRDGARPRGGGRAAPGQRTRDAGAGAGVPAPAFRYAPWMTMGFREPAGEAPPAPRQVSPDMRRDAAEHGRFLRLFGGIWAGVGGVLAILFLLLAVLAMRELSFGALIGGAFALCGSLLWLLGHRQRAAAESLFRDGVEASGVVREVFRDSRVRMNGRHPWRVVYEIEGPDGRPSKGTATFWDDEAPHATAGQRVIALHDPQNPSRSVLWTRLAGADGRLAQEAQRRGNAETSGKTRGLGRIAEPEGAPHARIAPPAGVDEEASSGDEERSVSRGTR